MVEMKCVVCGEKINTILYKEIPIRDIDNKVIGFLISCGGKDCNVNTRVNVGNTQTTIKVKETC